MKTSRLLAVAMLVIATWHTHAYAATTSSAPQGINYQSVARNSAGQILANQPVHLRISIRDSSAAGAIVYQEHHQVITNAFGTFSVIVGGGSIILGNFGNIAWGASDKYIQTDMDFSGGNNYQTLGTSKLQSIAYALYAGTSSSDISNVKYDTTGILNLTTVSNHFNINKPVWLSGGNSGLSAANAWLGTLDHQDVVIKQGSQEAVRYTTGGAMLATGNSLGTTPASGPGKRAEWIPAKGAFRAGIVTGTQWDPASVGDGSVAMGANAIASGVGAVALGTSIQAVDSNTMALGSGLIAKNGGNIVIGAFNDTIMAAGDTTAGDKALFQVGNGSSDLSRGNALTVQRDGDLYAAEIFISKTMSLSPSSVSVLLPGAIDPRINSYIKVGSLGLPVLNQVTLGRGKAVGQLLVLEGQTLLGGLTSFGVLLADNSPNVNLKQDMQILTGDILTLIWDGQTWIELSRSDN